MVSKVGIAAKYGPWQYGPATFISGDGAQCQFAVDGHLMRWRRILSLEGNKEIVDKLKALRGAMKLYKLWKVNRKKLPPQFWNVVDEDIKNLSSIISDLEGGEEL